MKERSVVFLLLIILCLLVCSATAVPLDPHTQSQFAEPLPIPAVLSPTSPGHYEVTMEAMVTDEDDKTLAGKEVLFSVITGPNAGLFATVITDANGMAAFTYTSSKLGKDTIVASFDPMGTGDPSSYPVTVEWVERAIPTPEFPSALVPIISLSAMAVMVYGLQRTHK